MILPNPALPGYMRSLGLEELKFNDEAQDLGGRTAVGRVRCGEDLGVQWNSRIEVDVAGEVG